MIARAALMLLKTIDIDWNRQGGVTMSVSCNVTDSKHRQNFDGQMGMNDNTRVL
jgi:hypothetical protein